MNKIMFLVIIIIQLSKPIWAHDPIFSIGPHVLFKDGLETSFEFHTDKSNGEREIEAALELSYGITGDWAAGIEIPYLFKQEDNNNNQGLSDINIFTKYRFWRKDSLALQESAALLFKVKISNGDRNQTPALGTGTTDSILGLTYGYEGRRWYRWASLRYRHNGTNHLGLHRGNTILMDFVGGIRPQLTAYTEPDTVWLLELNAEFSERSDLNNSAISNTGGNQWFLSPGIFWTKRNFAIKAGVQIPIINNLNGNQKQDDYRAKIVFEWHL
jgi:hypothetical protein